ncbi:Zinc finger MYM-type protein 1-like [Oopsacas minuta]|uniref:Zinc finger MYM-type protein 1-like n=1 Tax=Oopsacas minuta TaxID=111878 RepID=A0AAV7JFI9_9METZ|nr:Zinc finger MYM-type protein 1-like [Oopsacas minuta]
MLDFANVSAFGGSTVEATFSTKGFCDWRKLGDKCRKHDSSVCHMAAVETQKVWAIHQIIGTVDKQLDPNFRNEKFIDDNRKHLMTVLDIITFCAEQDIPVRGDDESVLLDYVKSEVEIASCYAILADEVKDASKKELLGAYCDISIKVMSEKELLALLN